MAGAVVPARAERYVFNQLTSIKLVLQILERRTQLSPEQQRLVQLGLEAAAGLTAELVQASAEAHRAERAGVRPGHLAGALPSLGAIVRAGLTLGLRGLGAVTRQALSGQMIGLRAQGPVWRDLRLKPRRRTQRRRR